MARIENLADDLLVDILLRLPFGCAWQCQFVCKRLNSIFSDPNLVTHLLNLAQASKKFIVYGSDEDNQWVITKEIPGLDRFSLSFLPCYRDGKEGCIVASCNDLLLCSTTRGSDDCASSWCYYVCNPFTKQWVQIPPAPCRHGLVPTGFVCDPYYTLDDQQGVVFNPRCRFRIVHAFDSCRDNSDPTFEVDVFSSETGEWASLKASRTRPFFGHGIRYLKTQSQTQRVISHGGKLHFRVGRSVVVYDPFTNEVCDDIDPPRDTWLLASLSLLMESLFVCRGCLYLCQLIINNGLPTLRLHALTDESDVDGRWNLVKYGSSYYKNRRGIAKKVKLMKTGRVLAMHPTNPDILFLMRLGETTVHSFNLSSGAIEDAGECPHNYYDWSDVFCLEIPMYLTPVTNVRPLDQHTTTPKVCRALDDCGEI